jgi:hypothetical protein
MEAAMVERNEFTMRNPTWWTDKNASAWDRVKGALQRDWEQTKRDFSSTSGQRLNQNVADTIKQSAGSEPVPPLNVKTRPTDPKVAAKDAEKARENLVKESENAAKTIGKAHEDIEKERLKLREKIGDAHETAAKDISKEHAKIDKAVARRDEAVMKWQDAEQDVRYGYSVRSQFPAGTTWNDELEGKIRSQWEGLGSRRSWDASRSGIRYGWDYAGRSLGGEQEAA